jgi:protein-L-isoaspartate(D-aspartate) O-methyltransferase
MYFDYKPIPSSEVTARMAVALDLGPNDKVLEIGTGGYATQTRAWVSSGAEVHTIDLTPMVDPETIGLASVYAHLGDGAKGIPHEAPFTAIVVTCGVTKIYDAWRDQLSERGKLLVPIGTPECQKLTLLEKVKGELEPRVIIAYVRFIMMRQLSPMEDKLKRVQP